MVGLSFVSLEFSLFELMWSDMKLLWSATAARISAALEDGDEASADLKGKET